MAKNKRLHKITMYADDEGVIQRVQVVKMISMVDDATGKIDDDLGERQKIKEYEIVDTIPAKVKKAITDRISE